MATVGAGVEPQYTIVTADGQPAVLLNINRQPDANTVAVVDEVKAELKAEINELRADVSEVKADVKDIKRKMTVLTQDMMQLRADQLGLERRMDALDSRPQ